ncbi:hypothetical protein MIR68_003545 [Amoeboaphelidium protococcarum]|nr:hypothetical protein MIR68_003545 [Amoeboaphelidium protococcarum]
MRDRLVKFFRKELGLINAAKFLQWDALFEFRMDRLNTKSPVKLTAASIEQFLKPQKHSVFADSVQEQTMFTVQHTKRLLTLVQEGFLKMYLSAMKPQLDSFASSMSRGRPSMI